jgi:hypothetical protein
MLQEFRLDLQLFAGEGAGDGGADGAATGETNADAGHQRLLELGVPADKIRKNRAYRLSTPAPKPAEAGQEQVQEQQSEQVAAAKPETEDASPPPRLTWKEIMADPEYNREMQQLVQARLRGAKAAQEAMEKLTPALELMARRHGLDAQNMDYDAIAKAINDDDAFYEDKALELGVTLETAKRIDQQERETARQQRQQAVTLEQEKIRQHIIRLEQQGEAMKQVFPDFDLKKELRNPVFARMTAPNVGISVQDAYYAVHRNEIQKAAMQVTAQKTAQKISQDIQAGSRRPREAGTTGQAPSVTTFDYRSMSSEQRRALKDRIRSGEKIYPGQV